MHTSNNLYTVNYKIQLKINNLNLVSGTLIYSKNSCIWAKVKL